MESNLPDKLNFLGIDKLTEPITKLIEVFAAGAGKLYEPRSIVNNAKAKAEAKLIEKTSEVLSESINREAIQFILHNSNEKLKNIKEITNKAIKYLPSTLNSNQLPYKGWILDFFDMSQNCSDSEIQEIWAKILADEVDQPNTHSRRIMHTLKLLEPLEAALFKTACECECFIKFKMLEEDSTSILKNKAVIIAVDNEIILEFPNEKVDYKELFYLTEIGLFNRIILTGEIEEDGLSIESITFNEHEISSIPRPMEIFEFTSLGYELSEIANTKANESHWKNVKRLLTLDKK